jgi:signal transduction histidine kinase
MKIAGMITAPFKRLAEQVVAGDQQNREVEVRRVVSLCFAMTALAGLPVLLAYPYAQFHGAFTVGEGLAVAGFLAAGACGMALMIKFHNSALAAIGFITVWLIVVSSCAIFSGGLQSPVAIWLVAILGLLSLVNDGRAVAIIVALVAAFLTVISALTLAGALPGADVPPVESAVFYWVSILSAVIFWALILSLLLTRRRDNERRLLALANAARAASNAKTEFLSTMTHEMRTPLNSVNGMSDVLLMTELDERQRRAVLSIQRAGFEILARVENMLEISSHDGKGVILQHHAFSIGDLVRGAIDALLPDLTAKGLALEVSVDPALANFYHTDTDRLTRVIKSLMDNAVKFTEEGTVAVKVERLRQSTDSDLIRFEVADTGIGIPEDQRDQIFSAFEQADSSLAREHGGAGLGLAVSRLIVEAMGSEIHFRSEVGQGTAFWFDLALEPLEPSHYRRQTSAGSGAI